jgi:predicted N-acetyltransferase YhbS
MSRRVIATAGCPVNEGVGLVDLRRRADDADVQALAALVHDEAGSAGPDELPRLLVGWNEGDQLVGGIGIEPIGDRELALTNLFVLDEFRLQGIGRSLVEAVVSGVPLERFRVECDAGVAGFFERCGFVPGSGGALVRDMPTEPAPEATAAVTLRDLEAAIRASWSQETSADPDEWTVDNPSRGQCDATAVVLRAYLGGEILVADILRAGRRIERHAWNRLSSGLALDLTRDQLPPGQELGSPSVQEPMLLGNARERHVLLAERVAAALAANQP